MRTTPAALLASSVMATLLLGAAPAAANTRVVLDKGHVDVVDVEYEGGAFDLHVHDEATDAEYDPADVRLRVPPAARTSVPADPGYSFLGAPGAPVWVLPQQENEDLLFAGLSTEELPTGVFASDSVTLKLVGVRGPGAFSLFTETASGAPGVLFNSADGLPDATPLTVAAHKHASWGFTRKGDYRLTFEVTGTLAAGGGTVRSAAVTYLFTVG